MNHIETGIQTADVNASAAIPAPIGPASNAGLVWNGSSWVAATLVNANINSAAAIAYSKLNLAGGIVNNDVSGSAAVAYSKLNLASSIVSSDIVDGTIVNADISASAAIAQSKLANGPGLELAYAELTTTVSSTTATEASPLDVVSAGSVTFDGTAVIVEFYAPSFQNGGAVLSGLSLWEDANDRGRLWTSNSGTAPSLAGVLRRKITPSAGAHTYKVRLWTAGSTNMQVAAGAGGVGTNLPAYIRVTKA